MTQNTAQLRFAPRRNKIYLSSKINLFLWGRPFLPRGIYKNLSTKLRNSAKTMQVKVFVPNYKPFFYKRKRIIEIEAL